MEWLTPYLFPMDWVIFFFLATVWLKIYYLSFFGKLEKTEIDPNTKRNANEKDHILQFFEFIFTTIIILYVAHGLSSYYDRYPNLLTGYTILCVVFLLGTDFISSNADEEEKDENF
jgi:hypothetical protein